MDMLKQIEALQGKGIRVTIDWINQIENGQGAAVKAGTWPLWTCTATAWHTITYDGKEIEDTLSAISADSISEAFTGLLELLGEIKPMWQKQRRPHES